MFFGYYFTACIVILVAIVIGIISGSIASRMSKKGKQTSILVGIESFFLVVCGICSYWVYSSPFRLERNMLLAKKLAN